MKKFDVGKQQKREEVITVKYEKPEVVSLGQASAAIQDKGQIALDAQPALSDDAYECDEE